MEELSPWGEGGEHILNTRPRSSSKPVKRHSKSVRAPTPALADFQRRALKPVLLHRRFAKAATPTHLGRTEERTLNYTVKPDFVPLNIDVGRRGLYTVRRALPKLVVGRLVRN